MQSTNWDRYELRVRIVIATLPLPRRIAGLNMINLRLDMMFKIKFFNWSKPSRICLHILEAASLVLTWREILSGSFFTIGIGWCFRSSIVASLKWRTLINLFFFRYHLSSMPETIKLPTIPHVSKGHWWLFSVFDHQSIYFRLCLPSIS